MNSELINLANNVVVVSLDTEGNLSQSAKFCLDVALHRDGHVDEVWVLISEGRPKKLSNSFFSAWGRQLKTKHIHLDEKTWPMDVGNNIYLRLPLSFYDALRKNNIPKTIYTPLNGGGAFFALQARKGGLLPKTTRFITTCYLPRRLEQLGNLTLPKEIHNVLDSELEELCAKLTDEFWISHDLLSNQLTQIFRLLNVKHIYALPLPAERQPLKQIARHIVFAGHSLPLYGFDAFCDLAHKLENELDEVTVIIQSSLDTEAAKWAKIAKKRLEKLNVILNWHYVDNPIERLNEIEYGVLIALMRAPFLPNTAKAAISCGLKTLWGTGFDIHLPNIETPALYPVVSDSRKAALALLKLWGNEDLKTGKPLILARPKITDVKTTEPQPIRPASLLSVIITHHNRPEFLDQCLKSLAEQTVNDFEVIVVDDGSDLELLQQAEAIIKNSPLKSIQLTKIENSYPAAARNHGAEFASGDTLFFVDDDNLLDPRSISAFWRAIGDHDLVLSFYQTFRNDILAFRDLENVEGRADLRGPAYGFAGLLPGCGVFHNLTGNASMMIRRETFMQLGGFSSKYGIGLEDYALLLKGAFRGGIRWVILPEAYLHFRLHENKIRNSHVDWVSPVRLQAGHWRVIEDLHQENSSFSTVAIAYARQLHELTQYTYISPERPKYFRLRSILLHQYLRPILSRQVQLRRWVVKFTSGESRFAKLLEKLLF